MCFSMTSKKISCSLWNFGCTQAEIGILETSRVQVGAPARVGLVAPVDVVVPSGNTGLDPSQTSFFQVIVSFYIILELCFAN